MKNYLLILIISIGLSGIANAGVSNANQIKLSKMLEEVGMESMWPQDISLWVKNPGFTKYELEGIGNVFCEGARGSGIEFLL